MPPLQPVDINLTFTQTTATVTFTVPFLVHGEEQYSVNYGTSMDALDESSPTVFSIDGEDMQYSISITGLLPGITYYFQLVLTNDISTTTTGVFSGTTMEDGKCIGINDLE